MRDKSSSQTFQNDSIYGEIKKSNNDEYIPKEKEEVIATFEDHITDMKQVMR